MRETFKRILRGCLILSLLIIGWLSSANVVEAKQSTKASDEPKVIAIDPGYQQKAANGKEPVGPGAFKTTSGVISGNIGEETQYAEYEMNLDIARKLENILEDKGYTVILTRYSSDVNISDSGRAMMANTAEADIMVGITANSDGSLTDNGVEIICQSEDNPYNYGNYGRARLLSDAVLGSIVQSTGNSKGDVIEDDNRPIINWSIVPTTIIEVGSLANSADEELLVTDEYQEKIAEGIAAGIESYFTQK